MQGSEPECQATEEAAQGDCGLTRDRIERLEAEIAFHRKVLATLNAVHAIKEAMPPFPRQVSSQQNLTDKPVTWAANIPGKFGAAPTMLFGYTENIVQSIAAAGGDVVKPFPLYRQPQPTLTPKERWVIDAAAHDAESQQHVMRAATLRSLLERSR